MKPLTEIPPLEARKCRCRCGKEFKCLPTSDAFYASQACAMRHTHGKYTWKVELDFKREWRLDKHSFPHYIPETDYIAH